MLWHLPILVRGLTLLNLLLKWNIKRAGASYDITKLRVIVFGDAELRNNLAELKDAELMGRKLFNQGDYFVRDTDAAVKYFDYSEIV